jgi:hypothetical protein
LFPAEDQRWPGLSHALRVMSTPDPFAPISACGWHPASDAEPSHGFPAHSPVFHHHPLSWPYLQAKVMNHNHPKILLARGLLDGVAQPGGVRAGLHGHTVCAAMPHVNREL